MSQQTKITPKNLTYDTTLPPFLARLHGQSQAAADGGPDPMLAARRRPTGRVRTASEEAEDAPVVVDERGNVVQLGADGEVVVDDDGEIAHRADGDGGKGESASAEKDGEVIRKKEQKETAKVAGIGATKKRKVGRVVGGDEGGDDDDDGDKGEKTGRKNDATKGTTKTAATSTEKPATAAAAKPHKKKAKKIKLSFGDDDDDGV